MQENKNDSQNTAGSVQQQPGAENISDGKQNENACANQPPNRPTNPGEKIGVEDEEINMLIPEPTEEEMDEGKNNARDAMNDDSYVVPAENQDDGKLD